MKITKDQVISATHKSYRSLEFIELSGNINESSKEVIGLLNRLSFADHIIKIYEFKPEIIDQVNTEIKFVVDKYGSTKFNKNILGNAIYDFFDDDFVLIYKKYNNSTSSSVFDHIDTDKPSDLLIIEKHNSCNYVPSIYEVLGKEKENEILLSLVKQRDIYTEKEVEELEEMGKGDTARYEKHTIMEMFIDGVVEYIDSYLWKKVFEPLETVKESRVLLINSFLKSLDKEEYEKLKKRIVLTKNLPLNNKNARNKLREFVEKNDIHWLIMGARNRKTEIKRIKKEFDVVFTKLNYEKATDDFKQLVDEYRNKCRLGMDI